jgi:hypothetical protein
MTFILSRESIECSTTEILLDTPQMKIITFREKSDIIWGLMDYLKEGPIKIGDYEIVLQGFRFDLGQARTKSAPEVSIDWPCFWLRGYGQNIDDLISVQEVEYYLLRSGFKDFSTVTEEITGISITTGSASRIFIIAPIYIRIITGSIEKDKAIVHVEVDDSIPVNRIKVVSPFAKGKDFRSRQIGQDKSITTLSYEVTGEPSDEPTALVRLFLTDIRNEVDIKHIEMSLAEIVKRNDRFGVFSFLLDQNVFRDWLGIGPNKSYPATKGRKDNLDRFEASFINLFALCGFHTIYMGKAIDIQGIDGITFSPISKDIIIISCVSSGAIQEKLEKMKPMINIIRNKFPSYTIHPIIASPIENTDLLNSYGPLCKGEKIGLITRSEINRFYEISTTGNVNDMISHVKKTIMSTE